MNALFLFETRRNARHGLTYLVALILLFSGIFCGSKFNLSVGEGIYLNSPYTLGFLIGLLSLSVIFLAVIYALRLLFKDTDSKFDRILFALPVAKNAYLNGRFFAYLLQTFLSFVLLITGFAVGQNLRTGDELQAGFHLWHYVYPLLIFGFLNSLLVCSFLFFLSVTTHKKLLVVAGGLLLYIFYMVVMIFSNSPFMAGSTPQSLEAQQLSAILDPFGLSSYFFEARDYTVLQRNRQVVSFSGKVWMNRVLYGFLSVLFLVLAHRLFSYSAVSGKKHKKEPPSAFQTDMGKAYFRTRVDFGKRNAFRSIFSLARIDLIYLFKSIAVPAVSVLLLFFVGMEMYAEIEKGIRLPQKYAGSGLMADTISGNFHVLGLLMLTYFINDLYWRSRLSGFSPVEKATYFSKNKLAGHLLSVTVLLFFFTGLLIAEGLVFQAAYDYFHVDGRAYAGVILFNTLPLILFAAFILILNDSLRNRFLALGISLLAVFTLTGPVSQKILPYPLLRIFSDFTGSYSDFNGYGVYPVAFAARLVFGLSLVFTLWMIGQGLKRRKWNFKAEVALVLLLLPGIYCGRLFMKGYVPDDPEREVAAALAYEKEFREYKDRAQPDITAVDTRIELYPSANAYRIRGKYTLKNQARESIHKVLVNFHPDLKIEKAWLTTASGAQKIEGQVSEVGLNQPLDPGQTATLDFEISYRWFPGNGHESFNAIIENGSFMRISRYYPVLGYQVQREVEDTQKRKEYGLGERSGLKGVDAPPVFKKDFIRLNMLVSTEKDQTALGTGHLTAKFQQGERNYFRYEAGNIPFRFAVSSARYRQESVVHKGTAIHVFFHENHRENVNHLIENAKLTLDYCIQNFGQYPFRSITFAEVSSFTRGFAATAYPGIIFMPENMVFHANIHADKKQDVINELAGHELSHLWWGNSQINPDDREGAPMLTETLAMYTEMMLYQKMYGREKMQERLKMHQQIYDSEKGLSENQPLYKVTSENTHISYSKGSVAMVKLSELIGEDRVNLALRNFLIHNQYPKKPSTPDLLEEFYKVSDRREEIDDLFKTAQ
ncbi:MAG: ABC-2 transporter permease [Leadbetterella sp.]|nr:ABC-2 transporter permease [Leadbetterella sp.]